MPKSSSTPGSDRPPTALLRVAVVFVLMLTAAAVTLQVAGVLAGVDRGGPVPLPPLAPAVITLMAGVALAAVVEGVARVVGGRATSAAAGPIAWSPDLATGPALDRLAVAMAELRSSLPDAIADAVRPTVPVDPPAELTDADVPFDPDGPPPPRADAAVSHLERVVHLLEELKELALLDEGQRQARGQMTKERRKATRVEEATLLLQRHEWEQADALLTLLESLYPGDAEVLAVRNELDDARSAHRDADWAQLVRQVEDSSALHRYDEAAAAVSAFRDTYPAHADAAGLAAQVASDREQHADRAATALFAEIKTAVDGRQWRMALEGIQRFLSHYPDHPRSDRIRQQVRTIQRNAEVEERHEQELRIRELAQAGRFAEAAGLCEDMLARFPDSPQVPALQNLLPKLRERSTMAEATAGSPFNG